MRLVKYDMELQWWRPGTRHQLQDALFRPSCSASPGEDTDQAFPGDTSTRHTYRGPEGPLLIGRCTPHGAWCRSSGRVYSERKVWWLWRELRAPQRERQTTLREAGGNNLLYDEGIFCPQRRGPQVGRTEGDDTWGLGSASQHVWSSRCGTHTSTRPEQV